MSHLDEKTTCQEKGTTNSQCLKVGSEGLDTTTLH